MDKQIVKIVQKEISINSKRIHVVVVDRGTHALISIGSDKTIKTIKFLQKKSGQIDMETSLSRGRLEVSISDRGTIPPMFLGECSWKI
ncbi:hypothetical protein A2Y83_05325 [Candidatus Falkowbacteria bacterium RBG_13_39_14]|uniref:Uncharacterized protein n=1 Tax=Candidatus Falkowbacteria bacterium RBG_13_39_14 TaxID=1797985 RepID=A0A1F5S543_9BACT|nr:MAG: hypothetical protein A2Y83_05325 [Candidatus Falkowbacteria bacterium RBG_13_39_14]